MLEESQPPSPRGALALVPSEHDWQPIFHVSNQVVLYNPTSHALSIRPSSNFPPRARRPCPYCKQDLPPDFQHESDLEDDNMDSEASFRASNYFQLLAIANETTSRPSTPPTPQSRRNTFPAEAMAEGYFKAFFQEECRLGMGANGSVYLCQHVLDGNPLGHFAVKKIAVGESHSYLLNILKEVRLLEQLHHPNIVTYHHAWLESCQFSSFGPKVPTLHVLMQWAEGGSLDDFIDVRLGRRSNHIHIHLASQSDTSRPQTPAADNNQPNLDSSPGPDQLSRSARIRAFREFQRSPPEQRERVRDEMARSRTSGSRPATWTAVHLLSAEEVKSLFRDIVEGLAFLHDKSILHLDLKPGNVLLTWDEGKLIPRAMLSDFGTSRDMLHSSRSRSGNTGTLEYTAPESLPSPRTGLLHPIDSKADMWSLGMILHKLLFFKLPYMYASDAEVGSKVDEGDKMDRLENEVLNYSGFKSSQTLAIQFEARRLPRAFLVLLEGLLHVVPSGRPSCERVSTAIREGRLDPVPLETGRRPSGNSLIPAPRRLSNADVPASDGQESNIDQLDQRSDGQDGEAQVTDGGIQWEEETKSMLLSLPAPIDNLTPWTMITARIPPIPAPRVRLIRTTKSCIVVAKVVNIFSTCSTGRPHPAAVCALVSLAVIDTWFDGLRISVFFGLLHLAVIRFGCWGSTCCT
ncbi:kinase-like protein [Mycena epipterygia]|nr:kinase-like protein [Mycena epipterygia]